MLLMRPWAQNIWITLVLLDTLKQKSQIKKKFYYKTKEVCLKIGYNRHLLRIFFDCGFIFNKVGILEKVNFFINCFCCFCQQYNNSSNFPCSWYITIRRYPLVFLIATLHPLPDRNASVCVIIICLWLGATMSIYNQ